MPRWPSATWRAVCASWHGLHPDRRLLQTSRRSGRSEIGRMWSTVFAAVSRPRLWHHQHNGSALSLASRSLRHALSYPRDAAEPRQRSCAWRWAAAPPCAGWWTGGLNGIAGAVRLMACAQVPAACQSQIQSPPDYEALSLWAQSLDCGYISALARPVVNGLQSKHATDAGTHTVFGLRMVVSHHPTAFHGVPSRLYTDRPDFCAIVAWPSLARVDDRANHRSDETGASPRCRASLSRPLCKRPAAVVCRIRARAA